MSEIFPSPSDRWVLMDAFFREKGLVRQHLDSFNDFVKRRLQEIVDEQGVIETDIPGFKIKLEKIEVKDYLDPQNKQKETRKPTVHETTEGLVREILPMEARLRNLTYSCGLYLKVIPIENGIEGDPVEVYIGRLPVMVKSILCPLSKMSREELIAAGEDPEDPGGYFIINGSERVLVAQEDLAVNRVLVDKAGAGSPATHIAKVFSSTAGFRVPVTLERLRDGSFYVSFPAVPGRIPFAILMRALGLETDKEIVEAVSDVPEIQQELITSIEQASSIATVKDALDYIGNRVAIGQTKEYRIRRAEQVIDKYLLPHLGMTLSLIHI